MTQCTQCKVTISNPIAVLLAKGSDGVPVCPKCVRRNHLKAMGAR